MYRLVGVPVHLHGLFNTQMVKSKWGRLYGWRIKLDSLFYQDQLPVCLILMNTVYTCKHKWTHTCIKLPLKEKQRQHTSQGHICMFFHQSVGRLSADLSVCRWCITNCLSSLSPSDEQAARPQTSLAN